MLLSMLGQRLQITKFWQRQCNARFALTAKILISI